MYIVYRFYSVRTLFFIRIPSICYKKIFIIIILQFKLVLLVYLSKKGLINFFFRKLYFNFLKHPFPSLQNKKSYLLILLAVFPAIWGHYSVGPIIEVRLDVGAENELFYHFFYISSKIQTAVF